MMGPADGVAEAEVEELLNVADDEELDALKDVIDALDEEALGDDSLDREALDDETADDELVDERVLDVESIGERVLEIESLEDIVLEVDALEIKSLVGEALDNSLVDTRLDEEATVNEALESGALEDVSEALLEITLVDDVDNEAGALESEVLEDETIALDRALNELR